LHALLALARARGLGAVAGGARRLAERAGDAPLEEVREADARVALERARLDVLLGHLEPGEVRVVLVFRDAGIADAPALAGGREEADRQDAEQGEGAGQDRSRHRERAPRGRATAESRAG